MSLKETYEKFIQHNHKCRQVNDVIGVLGWDQEVMMPEKGTAQRADQIAYLSSHHHELVTSPAYIESLETLDQGKNELSKVEAKNVALELRTARRSLKVPSKLVETIAKHEVLSHEKWKEARQKNDYNIYKDTLEEMVRLKKEYGTCVAEGKPIYQALFEDYEPDTPIETTRQIFKEFGESFIPLIPQIVEKYKSLPTAKGQLKLSLSEQRKLTKSVLSLIGYDFDRGRVDEAVHPFCTGGGQDVRVTTRYEEEDWSNSLYSVMHEGGHAIYEMGMGGHFPPSPVAEAPGMAIHESQSRFYENHIGRSRAFCEVLLPKVKEEFGIDVPDVDPFFNHVNHVAPSYIRVDADEATYNLHILLRFEIEDDLFSDKIGVGDLKEAWNNKVEHYLQLPRPDDANGLLQDVHWSMGGFGYFPTYTLGNFVAAQFEDTMNKEFSLEEAVQKKEFPKIKNWLFEKVHQFGSTKDMLTVVKEGTDSELSCQYFINYIKRKFL